MDLRKMTDLEIYELGIEFLIDKLGSAGMMRFFSKGDPSKGDYSVDRHKLPQPNMDTIVKDIQRAQATEQPRVKVWKTATCSVNTQKMKDFEVYEVGIRHLKTKLGPTGLSRFLSQCEPLAGDYSVDWHKRPMPSIDTIIKESEQEDRD